MAESSRSVGEVINVGSNREISIGELARKIRELCSSPSRSRRTPNVCVRKKARSGACCATIARRVSLSVGRRSGVRRGARQTIEWFSQNLSRYKTDIYNL